MSDPLPITGYPSPNGANGRDAGTGRFALGNPGGPGNPLARRAAELRSALLSELTPDDVQRAIRALVDAAHAGDVPAIRELFNRVFGKSAQPILAAIAGLDQSDGLNVAFYPAPRPGEIGIQGGPPLELTELPDGELELLYRIIDAATRRRAGHYVPPVAPDPK